MTTLAPYRSVSKGLRELLRTAPFLASPEQVGGSLPGPVIDYYVRLEGVSGGTSTQTQGRFIYDVEVFHPSYVKAESAALHIDALLLGYSGNVEVPGEEKPVRIDKIEGGLPSRIYWDDDGVTRFQGTYTITVRR